MSDLKTQLEQTTKRIASARVIARAIIDGRQKEKSAMSLADLKHLAEKSRDRIERITQRAAKHDARGDDLETRSNEVLDAHDAVFDALDTSFDDLEAFNAEMRSQLGNEPKKLGSASPKSDERPKASADGTITPQVDVGKVLYGDGVMHPKL